MRMPYSRDVVFHHEFDLEEVWDDSMSFSWDKLINRAWKHYESQTVEPLHKKGVQVVTLFSPVTETYHVTFYVKNEEPI